MTIVSHDCEVAQARAEYQRAFALEKAVLMLRYGCSGTYARIIAGVMPEVASLRMELERALVSDECPEGLSAECLEGGGGAER